MAIHWFPGHMATARKEIRRVMPTVDLVIELLDARIPFSSENPVVAELRGERPCIQVLNKSDLADPAVTAEWVRCLEGAPAVRVITRHLHEPHFLRTLLALRAELAPPHPSRPTNAILVGVPNVGKSTVMNALAGRNLAKTGNKPAITQVQQRVVVGRDLVVLDTPGFLWPKLSPEACGYRLAVTGAISDRVVDYEDLAGFALRFLSRRYPAQVARFYGLEALPEDVAAALDAIGRRRGHLVRGGGVDRQRASETLIRDLRAGAFGAISLERPSDCGRAPRPA